MIDSCSLTLPEPESIECQTGTLGGGGDFFYEHKTKWPSNVQRINLIVTITFLIFQLET